MSFRKGLSAYSNSCLLSYGLEEKESWSLLFTSQRNEQPLLQELVTPRPLEAHQPQASPAQESQGCHMAEAERTLSPFHFLLLNQQSSVAQMSFCTKSFCMDGQHSI